MSNTYLGQKNATDLAYRSLAVKICSFSSLFDSLEDFDFFTLLRFSSTS